MKALTLAGALLALASAAPAGRPPSAGLPRSQPCEAARRYDEAGRRNARPLPPPRNWMERRSRTRLETVI